VYVTGHKTAKERRNNWNQQIQLEREEMDRDTIGQCSQEVYVLHNVVERRVGAGTSKELFFIIG
jgi:hypothetical protein